MIMFKIFRLAIFGRHCSPTQATGYRRGSTRNIVFALLLLTSQILFATSFQTQHWTMKNGVRVVFYPAKEVPMLDISIAFAAGSAYDGAQFGVSHLTTQLLNQGNHGLTANQIAEKLEKTGAQFSAEANRDMIVLNLRTLSSTEALTGATDALSLIINAPDFPQDHFVREKNQQLLAIKQVYESPETLANHQFFQVLYGNHPYAHPTIGDEAHVNAITLDQVKDFYHRYFIGNNAVIVLVGAIDTPTAHQIADKLVANLPVGKIPLPLPEAHTQQQGKIIQTPFPSSQTMIRMGQLGITYHNPHYFELLVGNHILGGASLVSTLAIELREKRGLTYGVTSQFLPMPGVGPFVISLATRNEQAKNASQLTRKILTDYIDKGPTEKELQATKRFLTGGFPLSLASNRNIAETLLKIAFYHLPENYLNTYVQRVNEVTAQAIKTAFQAQISPKNLLEVSVGKL
jgi:zinc protease